MTKPAIERFTQKYIIDPTTECWNWSASTNKSGYGYFKYPTGDRAHRFSYEHFNGQIPEGLLVCHTCDNPSCVNPGHLFVGTSQVNMTDKVQKNRQSYATGELHGDSKLTELDVIEIKHQLTKPYRGIQNKLAEQYCVSPSTISLIKLNVNWKHIIT